MSLKKVIELPLHQYRRFLKRCDAASREYEILEIGPILRRPKEGHYDCTVEIHCEMSEAQILLEAAKRIYPRIVPAIANAGSLSAGIL
jgi:hypothetical protein